MEWRATIISRPPDDIRRDMAEVLANWSAFPGNDDPSRKGCVVTVFDDGTGDLCLPQEFLGEIPPGKSQMYAFYSLEKGVRLGDHPDHLTSAASALSLEENRRRGASDKKYAGATRAKGFLRFSTSGFSGVGDQAFSAAMQDRAGLLNDELLGQIEQSDSMLARTFVEYDRLHRS